MKGFVVDPSPTWYTSVPPLPPKPDLPQPTAAQLSSLTERASSLLSTDAEKYASSSAAQSTSDAHFLKTILSTGTLSDRLSALTLLVQASPVHNTAALESLRSMAQRGRAKGGRDEGLKAVRCVADWWVGGGGPGRKLKYFRDQPLSHPDKTDSHLVIWYFEDWLKKYFFSMLQILETFSLDPLPYVRTQTLAFLATLLRAQPEQEQNLLRLLVNKLGDTEKSVCSRASYHLLQVLQAHPAMKGVIVREVRALIFRLPASTAAQAAPSSDAPKNSHIRFSDDSSSSKAKAARKDKEKASEGSLGRWNSHAWYYASVTLNQVVLTPTTADRAVARTLVDMYFEMFEEILGSKRDEDESDGEGDAETKDKKDKQDKKGKGRDTPKAKDKKQKRKEIKGEAGFAEVEDSSSRLIGAILTGVNRALPFAQMHLSSDSSAVFQKHIDTLFRITHTSTFNISLQALTLILQISTTLSAPSSSKASSSAQASSSTFSASLRDRFYRTLYASLTDPRLGTSNKQALYLNLVFKALKADHDTARVAAFVRRFVQVLASGAGAGGAVEFVAGGLYLLGELFNTTPGLKQLLSTHKSKAAPAPDASTYDPRKRDPQYAHAFASPMYELLPLLHHYHPTISLHARQLFTSAPITGSPDLSLNTLSHFLDRFVYKNPKKPKPKGSSAMQPSLDNASSAHGVTLVKGEAAHGSAVPVNDERFWKRRVEDVPVDEAFFHAYFVRKNEREKQKAVKVAKRKGKGGEDDDDEDEDDDEDVDEVSDAESGVSGDEDEGEEVEDGSDSEDGGFDLSSKGNKPAPAEDDEDEEENSDAEEAEIWKAMKATMPKELDDDDLMEDSEESDEVPSGLDDLSEEDAEEEEDASADEEDADEEPTDAEDAEDDDALSLVEGSDAEDLLPLDAEVSMGLIEYDGSESEGEDEAEEWGGISSEAPKKGGKRKRDEDGKKAQRKKLRSLPTFASYDDYAKLIEDGPEDNI
ncbi:CBF-domain-containing protein [Lentinus tigrinus ALCF2SS1-7]|uniref:CBF-domain-containing protein n=1 Tax=Lentinus tigrinus ALCF2SS1-6 TaxID=1328759 RepID=A0A5C2S3V2_9APHY|nr:CBF-domain-containing protein [Lentinus tigrinus ALCF2SS1-6]RPD72889.1 CBF-domain-containing protein [Lentinus tigrinus ALCF2SS1-7]